MLPRLDTPVKELGPIGRRCAAALGALGVRTVRDLLFHLPSRYDDFSASCGLAEAGEDPVTVRVRVDMIRSRRSPKKRMLLTEAVVSDATGAAKVVWFRQPYIAKLIRQGDIIRLSGRVDRTPWGPEMANPAYEKETGRGPVHTGRLVPVYPLAGTLTAKQVRTLLHLALPAASALEETIDGLILKAHGLMGLAKAVRAIHFPETREEAAAADRRFRFEELLRFQLRGALARRALAERRAPVIPFDEGAVRRFVAALPFPLTDDQKKAAWSILQDMASGEAMHRLLEGDVGSGKTAVAALAAFAAAEAGFRTLLMAPTEILAEQHHATFVKLLAPIGHEVSIRTRTNRGAPATVTVGTHALLAGGLELDGVGLVIVDEQHRFGVAQRQALLEPLGRDGEAPHFLSMTATPIPRTLALALYGDVAVSRLRHMPAGRLPIRTMLVGDDGRAAMHGEIASELAAGHGVFVVCPLIEPSDVLGVRSAEETAERMQVLFPASKVGLLHGKMKAEEKRAVMDAFASGKLGILVSTTVVEVGVDVPRATVMVIEGAERFGLAQLHQLRGRVGRSRLPSACYLIMTDEASGARARLEEFARARDCFEISELDLRLRGPGSLLGEAQSGFGELGRFDPHDLRLIEETKEAAEALLERDPRLENSPALLAAASLERVHLE